MLQFSGVLSGLCFLPGKRRLLEWMCTAILLTSSCGFHLTGQGLLPDDALFDQQPRWPDFVEGSKAELETLKGIYKIDLRPFCPAPQDQGLIASCTGWASGYAAQSILQAIDKDWHGQEEVITEHAFSALFIYNQIRKGGCEFGAYMTDAAILLRDKGNIPSKQFDRLKNKCDRLPTEQEQEDALQFRIKDFVTVFGPSDPSSVRILRTKLALVQQKPVVIGMSLLKNFEGLAGGYDVWYPQVGDTTINGGHSLVVVGFDDGKEAFEVMNSWGPDWGNDGFVWIKYRDFGKYCQYGYVLIPASSSVRFVELSAALSLRSPVYPDPQTLEFRDEPLRWNGQYYELQNSLKKGAVLQPFLREVDRDSYFYAFSIDARNTIRVHWPRDASLDSKFEGPPESAIMTIPDIGLAIPGRYAGLVFNTPGTEYLCFLISQTPVTKLNEYLTAFRTSTITDFQKRFRRAFGGKILTGDRVKYASDRMQAESDMQDEEIVAILVRLKIQ